MQCFNHTCSCRMWDSSARKVFLTPPAASFPGLPVPNPSSDRHQSLHCARCGVLEPSNIHNTKKKQFKKQRSATQGLRVDDCSLVSLPNSRLPTSFNYSPCLTSQKISSYPTPSGPSHSARHSPSYLRKNAPRWSPPCSAASNPAVAPRHGHVDESAPRISRRWWPSWELKTTQELLWDLPV